MKSQNKKILIIFTLFLSLLDSYAQNNLNQLFFNLPLESSRDSIYSSIKKYGFIEKNSNQTISQNDTIIKTFYGYLDIKPSRNILADSIKIQLSTGSSYIENEKYYQNSLIVWSYHHFSNAKTANKFYKNKKLEMEKITSKKPFHYESFEEGINTGFSDEFEITDNDKKISIKFKKEKLEYVVILEYQRSEGEKKLLKQFIKKKELIFREIDTKDLFHSSNVEQVPITKKCSTKNQKSIECFKESILRHILNDVDFHTFNLTPGKHRIALNFIIDKSKNIINIKAFHPNNKLCEEIIKSTNEINIIEPAINKGIKVDYLAEIALIISIDN